MISMAYECSASSSPPRASTGGACTHTCKTKALQAVQAAARIVGCVRVCACECVRAYVRAVPCAMVKRRSRHVMGWKEERRSAHAI